MQAPLRVSGAGLTPSLHRPNLLFLSSYAYRHPPNCHATEPKSTLSAHTNATYTDKRTDIEELPTSLFTVASQEFPWRFFLATNKGRSAATAHTAPSAYKPAHTHSCSPRPSPNATLPQPIAESKNQMSTLHDGLLQQAPHYASRTTGALSAASPSLPKRTHCDLCTALKPFECTACLLSGRNKTQKHSMPRRVFDRMKGYINSCQRLMLSTTILHGPNLHAHSAPTQFYSRTA